MSLGEEVRRLRDKKGLTLDQLAELSGVEVGTISALENRKSERSKFAPALAKALGTTVEALTLGATYQPSEPVTLLPVKEPLRAFGPSWPLTGISPDQWANNLSDQDRGEIIGFAKSILMNRLASGKQTMDA
jgi:transcriptional regulator with XRE-family HTH domain